MCRFSLILYDRRLIDRIVKFSVQHFWHFKLQKVIELNCLDGDSPLVREIAITWARVTKPAPCLNYCRFNHLVNIWMRTSEKNWRKWIQFWCESSVLKQNKFPELIPWLIFFNPKTIPTPGNSEYSRFSNTKIN